MNPQVEHDLATKYSEFKNTAAKIGLEEALVRRIQYTTYYKSIK
jgi:hypothetical protein